VDEVRCKGIRWMLALYDSGELSPEEQEKVEAHLASCERCRQELTQLSKVPALIQSLHEDTWWADVSSPVMERLNASKAKRDPSQAKAIKAEKKGIKVGRAPWQLVLTSLLVVAIVVGAILAVIHPWEGDNVAQAADAARNNLQVQAILGGEDIEDIEVTNVEIRGRIAYVECRARGVPDVTLMVEVDPEAMRVLHIQQPIIQRHELPEDERIEAIEIAEADSAVQKLLGEGFEFSNVGYSSGSSSLVAPLSPLTVQPVLLILKKDTEIGEYQGVVVDLESRKVTIGGVSECVQSFMIQEPE
jgi:hypothetical protein